MEEQQRKDRFVELLSQLLEQSDGVKMKLAIKLGIKPSTLTPWLQGKIDPASLDIVVFNRLAELLALSVDEVAILLDVVKEKAKPPLEDKFRSLIEELLSVRSQQELAQSLDLSQNAISRWINPQILINPRNLNIATMAAIALEKKWTIERLLIYLGLKEKKIQENLLSRIKLEISSLSPREQVELLDWFYSIVEKKKDSLLQQESVQQLVSENWQGVSTSNRQELSICIILEKENIAIATNYASNLVLHFHLQPDNITIATPRSLPDSLSVFDVLLFDLNNQQSPCIPLIESLAFDGDVVAIVDRSLPQDIQDRLKQKVTEVILKPVPWDELKEKPYFLKE